MKRLLSALLAAGLLLSCAACGQVTPAPGASPEQRPAQTGTDAQTNTDAPAPAAEDENTDAPANPDGPATTDGPAPTDGPAIAELTADTKGYSVPGLEVLPPREALGSFALELLRRSEGENPVVSPLSAWFALAMAGAGSAGQTAEEFAALLGVEPDRLGLAAGSLATVLGMRAASDSLTLRAANSAWVDGSATIREDYLRRLAMEFSASLFAGTLSSREALEAMNGWVNEQTEGLIPRLFEEPLDGLDRLVLINTLYMKARWRDPFEPFATHEQEFRAEDGVINAPFMGRTAYMDYLSGEGYAGVVLPYADSSLSFVALLPQSGTARELLASLTAEELAALQESAASARVSLRLPKFSVEFGQELNAPLQAMGLVSAFDADTADFSPMSPEPLYIGRVLQKVKLIVDEEGTEAAAATAVEMRAGSALIEEEPIPLVFDKPFVYAVTDSRSGAVLFAGVLDRP